MGQSPTGLASMPPSLFPAFPCPAQPSLTLSSVGNVGILLAPLTHGDVPGSAEQEIDKDRIEGAVEAKHGGQSSQEGIGQAWRWNGSNVDLEARVLKG